MKSFIGAVIAIMLLSAVGCAGVIENGNDDIHIDEVSYAEKYYDYFKENSHISHLVSETGGEGFSDAQHG